MSKRVLLYAAAAFMAASSIGFVDTAMAAPRTDMWSSQTTYAVSGVPNASRFRAYAGQRLGGLRDSRDAQTWQDTLASHG